MAETIKIGCSTVLTGHEAVHGEAIIRAASLAVDQANESGHPHRNLELVTADDRDEEAAAIRVAERFAAMPDLIGVVGPMNSNAEFAAGPVYERAGLAHISPAASNPELTRRGLRTFFRMAPDDLYQGAKAAEFAVRYLRKIRLGVMHDGTPFGRPLAEIFVRKAKELGAEILCSHEITRGQKEFGGVASEVAGYAPDLIFLGVIEEEGLLLAPQFREGGVESVFMGADGIKASRYLETPGHPAKGPFHTNACCDIGRQASARGLKSAYEKRFGPTWSVYSAEAYDAAAILCRAVFQSEKPTRESVLKQVTMTAGYAGAIGRISFDSNGDRLNPAIGFYELQPNQVVFLGLDRDLFE